MNMLFGQGGYPLSQHYQFQGKQLHEHLDEALAAVAESGLQAYEPAAPDERGAEVLQRLLVKHGLAMPSTYLNLKLHTPDWRQVADEAVRRASVARSLGATVLVVNPEPIAWNDKSADKNDEQLRVQAGALRHLTESLREAGVTLAYHTHDMEMRNAAREMHHMLIATRGVGMGWCLDNHWVYRGAGDSQVALEDAVTLYGDRIVSLHVRQSRNGVWTETLCDGDVDFAPIVTKLRQIGFDGPIILEQAYENGTPRDLPIAESLRRSLDWARRVFS